MKVEGEQHLVAQAEEDIVDIKWVKESELSGYLANTYNNIIELIEKYYDKSNQVN